MTELDSALRRFVLEDVPRDWDDVLRRAARRRRALPRRPLVLALAVALVLVAAPAFAYVGGLFASGPGRLHLVAELRGPHGVTAELELTERRLLVARTGNRTSPIVAAPVGRRRGAILAPLVHWRLTTAHGAARAVLRRTDGRVVATLCAPCKPVARGLVRVAFRDILRVLGGSVVAEVQTANGSATGRLRRR